MGQAIMKPKNGYVYAVHDKDRGITKIGRASNAEKRIAGIVSQGGMGNYESFFMLTADYYNVELLCHQKFHDKRINGTEWFFIDIDCAKSCIESFCAAPTHEDDCKYHNFALSVSQHASGEKFSEPRIDSREIANTLDQKHRTILENIDKYKNHFDQLGDVVFLRDKKEGRPQGGFSVIRYAMLNEDHCYFLLSLIKNTEQSVIAKLNFIKQFSSAR